MVPTITADQRHHMDEQGFVVFENVFSPEQMAELGTHLEAFFERHRKEMEEHGDSGISRASEILFTSHLAESDENIRAFVTGPEFVALSTAFLGPDTDLYWNQTVYKMPEGDKLFPWHQDDAYTRVEPYPYLTLWLAVEDATEENGCISVLPGSHKNGFVPHEQSSIGLVCHSADDPEQGILVPLKQGSIAAFWSLTMHKSGPNRSKGMRKGYVIQYTAAGTKFMESGELITDKIPVARNGQPA